MSTTEPAVTERDPRTDPLPLDQVGGRAVVYVSTAGLVFYDTQQADGKHVQRSVLLKSWRSWAKGKAVTVRRHTDAPSRTHSVEIDSGLFFQINFLANKYLRDHEVRGQSTPFDQTLRTLLDLALLHHYTFQSGHKFSSQFREIMQREVPSRES